MLLGELCCIKTYYCMFIAIWICKGLYLLKQDALAMVALGYIFPWKKEHERCLTSEASGVQPLVFSTHSYSKHLTLETRSLLFTQCI